MNHRIAYSFEDIPEWGISLAENVNFAMSLGMSVEEIHRVENQNGWKLILVGTIESFRSLYESDCDIPNWRDFDEWAAGLDNPCGIPLYTDVSDLRLSVEVRHSD